MRLRAPPNVVTPPIISEIVVVPSETDISRASCLEAEAREEFGAGPSQIAARVVHALEAGDDSLARLPTTVARHVMIALGLSAAERQDLAQSLAVRFRSDLVAAAETAVHMALVESGRLQGQ